MQTTTQIVLACIAAAVLGAGIYLWTPDKALSELEPKYLKSKNDYLAVAGMRLHVRDTGPRDAPVLMLLHGFGASLHTWEPWAKTLEMTYRVVRLDLPGFGLSGPAPANDYSDGRSSDILLALMDDLGISRATVIGNSVGGRIAWTFAAAHPEKIEKLVLISPDGFASPGFEYGKATAVPAVLHLMRYVLPKAMLAPNLAAAYADPAFMSDALLDRYYDLMLAPGNRAAMIARMEQTVLTPPQPVLRSISAETLLLWGEKDGMIPVANAADYMREMHHATLVTLPGIGHLPHEEAPEVSILPLQTFLARPAAPR
ncbi:MAG: alpha/beta hydrolase [Hyphomicrobiaceae bacterium]|nr:alpha/beta hydrolase [Hyphomicrobiaceae bacterium]